MTAKDHQSNRYAEAHSESVRNAEAQIKRHAELAQGVVGVAAWRLSGDQVRLTLNATELFPMASTFKVAVACKILQQIDAGSYGLNDLVDVPETMRVASSVIAERFLHPGIQLSVHNLLQVMLDESDNTATDVLTAKAGGPEAVTTMLRQWGIADQRVDRDTRGLIRDFYELEPGPFMPALLKGRERLDHVLRSTSPNPNFEDDERDTSSPLAMNLLMEQVFAGKVLSQKSVQVLRDVMGLCRTADRRIRALLPQDTFVADKTGTIGGVVNDVGLIVLPDGRGEILLSVFIKKAQSDVAQRERVIAEISRTVYDFFLFLA
jgi:beta-lactamase class A